MLTFHLHNDISPTLECMKSTQTSPILSQGTPRKRRQKKIIACQIKQLSRLRAKLNKKKMFKKEDKKKIVETLNTLLPERIVNFIEMQIDLHSTKGKGRRYSKEMRAFALSLYHVSGKAYRLVSKLFYLPSKSSLRRWVSGMSKSPELNDEAMKVIETKVRSMTEHGRLCSLCLDEMSLKNNLFYDSYSDEVVGFENYGKGEKTATVATSAIVVMARGITENWKQPLGYFLVHESCNSAKVKEIIDEAIEKLHTIGLMVMCIVTDLGSNFHQLTRELGVTPSQPWLTHEGRKIFYLFDPPHLIKAIRNNLMKYNFQFGKFVASWKDIRILYEKDSVLSIRCCPKLTDKHLNPNGFQKMKEKLATHVISHTVAAAILTYVSLNALPPSATGTAEFLLKFDEIFDSLNSSNLNSPEPHRRAMSASSVHKEFIPQAINFVQSLKVMNVATGEDVTNKLRCIKGFQITLQALLLLWDELQQEHSLKFLMTRHLNQDALENFFGSVRQQGGNSDSPTPIQFSRAFRKLFFDNFLAPSVGNCIEDLDLILAGGAFNKSSSLPSEKATKSQVLDIDVNDYRSAPMQSNITGMNAVAYVSGYLLKKCFQRHECQICRSHLISNNLDDTSKLFCYFKAYQSQTETTSGLLSPTTDFITYFSNLERMFAIYRAQSGNSQVVACKSAKVLFCRMP